MQEQEQQTDTLRLSGDLSIPKGAKGLVLFAHGSGSSRHSPRNTAVARAFQQAGLGTFLIDLLTEDEETIDSRTRDLRFDIPMLAGRVAGAISWLKRREEARSLRVGLFGSSTGAAAALVAAARHPDEVAAVVSRGGRPDLADDHLAEVRAPTLLIVGERDEPVIRMNREAAGAMQCENELTIVPGASHLFEEPGTLDQVADLARDWFSRHLQNGSRDR